VVAVDSTEELSVSLKRVVLGSIDDVCRFYPIVIEQELAVLLDKSVPATRIAARKWNHWTNFVRIDFGANLFQPRLEHI
jgi:hypothetical protein